MRPERPHRAGDTGPERPFGAGDTGPERPFGAGDTGPERPHRAGDTGPERLAAWVFVDDLEALDLAPGDAHHLGRVLRLRLGEAVGASDGAGRWRRCAVAGSGGGARLEPTGAVVADPEPQPPVTIGFSLVKGDRPELVVQKLTELGVDRIQPLAAARSVVRWDADRAARGVERLRLVAREAAMQARRSRFAEIGAVATVAATAATLGGNAGMCEQGAADRPTLRRPSLLVGPEGGWDDEELGCGLPLIGLGPTTLRAETAAIAAGVLLCGLRSATVREENCGLTPPN